MMGDYHVRFCERLGVKFPLPTRLQTVLCKLKNQPHKAKSAIAHIAFYPTLFSKIITIFDKY